MTISASRKPLAQLWPRRNTTNLRYRKTSRRASASRGAIADGKPPSRRRSIFYHWFEDTVMNRRARYVCGARGCVCHPLSDPSFDSHTVDARAEPHQRDPYLRCLHHAIFSDRRTATNKGLILLAGFFIKGHTPLRGHNITPLPHGSTDPTAVITHVYHRQLVAPPAHIT